MVKWFTILTLTLAASHAFAKPERETLLHVSYDATRELFADYNRHFKSTHPKARIRMSHGGSGKQARSVMDGLPADVVSLALEYDVEMIAQKRAKPVVPRVPFYSTIVFLVRAGNPKQIYDWGDLTRPDVRVLTPNPKSSGGARWGYLAAWGYAQARYGENSPAARDYMKSWLRHVPVFDTGARAATTNFVRRKQGDVLITWENEAHLAQKYFGADAFEIVMPRVTIKAEPVVAVLSEAAIANDYVEGLFGPDAQALAVQHFFRSATMRDDLQSLNHTRVLNIEAFGGWKKAQAEHFDANGLFDQFMKRSE
ncbi:MAG: sulfate ABC transporter substrate-binding protein [Alphaproteobacteria bacterium]|nr:sulfate ABC transporter substrate-binding protein [Alphaproteobacteria bacterium]